jgi:predicted kinase
MAFLVLIVGSPASGKTTLARLLANKAKRGVHIAVDDLRDLVCGGVVHPGPNWSSTLVEQVSIARENATDIALRYAGAGFDVFIDDFWDPHSLLSEYDRLHRAHPSLLRVMLTPSRETALARNANRFANDGAMRAAIDAGIHSVNDDLLTRADWFTEHGWRVHDNTRESPVHTAQVIARWCESL